MRVQGADYQIISPYERNYNSRSANNQILQNNAKIYNRLHQIPGKPIKHPRVSPDRRSTQNQ